MDWTCPENGQHKVCCELIFLVTGWLGTRMKTKEVTFSKHEGRFGVRQGMTSYTLLWFKRRETVSDVLYGVTWHILPHLHVACWNLIPYITLDNT